MIGEGWRGPSWHRLVWIFIGIVFVLNSQCSIEPVGRILLIVTPEKLHSPCPTTSIYEEQNSRTRSVGGIVAYSHHCERAWAMRWTMPEIEPATEHVIRLTHTRSFSVLAFGLCRTCWPIGHPRFRRDHPTSAPSTITLLRFGRENDAQVGSSFGQADVYHFATVTKRLTPTMSTGGNSTFSIHRVGWGAALLNATRLSSDAQGLFVWQNVAHALGVLSSCGMVVTGHALGERAS